MIAAAPASPALSRSTCTLVRGLPPDLADAREIPQARNKPLSGAAVGMMRFRAEARSRRAQNMGFSHRSAGNPLNFNGTEPCAGPVSILDRRHFQCSWIDGAEGGIATCCGMPVVGEASWCREHAGRVFSKGGEP